MRRHLALLVTLAAFLIAASAQAHDEELQAELLDEVLRMTHAGVPDHLIIRQIEAMAFEFELTADDIVELRTLGVSDLVLEALIDSAILLEEEPPAEKHVVVSAGFYSPWYCFPYAWGFYYDPFPRLYSHYYYPFHYQAHFFGYYGGIGGTYYLAYERHRFYNDRRPQPTFSLASQRPARGVEHAAVPATSANGAVAPPPRVRERRSEPAPGSSVESRRRRGSLDASQHQRASRAAEPVAAPVRGGSRQGRSGEPAAVRVIRGRSTYHDRSRSPRSVQTRRSSQARTAPRRALTPRDRGSSRRSSVTRPSRALQRPSANGARVIRSRPAAPRRSARISTPRSRSRVFSTPRSMRPSRPARSITAGRRMSAPRPAPRMSATRGRR
ncbi:MAG: hypothetical protein JSW67_05490 [Candidatus Latescibacterota bacterium]|nr:MAG: hypothetical protein JSW67_05490 [Candidatus Latescibacterota bacterium]